MPRDPTRDKDEEVLCWLQLHERGLTATVIARMWQTYPQRVSGAIKRVEEAEPLVWQPEALQCAS